MDSDPDPDPGGPKTYGSATLPVSDIPCAGVAVGSADGQGDPVLPAERSASGSISQRYGSADPDPDQNSMDPQHW
jgi:hypothetical protein